MYKVMYKNMYKNMYNDKYMYNHFKCCNRFQFLKLYILPFSFNQYNSSDSKSNFTIT